MKPPLNSTIGKVDSIVIGVKSLIAYPVGGKEGGMRS